MKNKQITLIALACSYLLGISAFAQLRKGVENDDMYFSKKDRELLYASGSTGTSDYYGDQSYDSDYYASHNFSSPTVQSATAGSPTVQAGEYDEEADNNQYFIKDYSLPKEEKEYEKIVVNNYYGYGGTPYGYGWNSGITFSISFGSFYGYPYYGYGYYDPFFDPFYSYYYYDPFYRYYDPWNYAYYRYDPWRYQRYNRYGYYNGYYNSSSCFYPSHGYTNYSNVKNEVKYRNGRKIVSGTRSGRTVTRPAETTRSRGGVVDVSGVNTNGRTNGTNPNSSTYRRSRSSSGTVNQSGTRSRTNSYNSNNRSNNSSYQRSNSSYQRSNSSYGSSGSSNSRSSGYSSGSRSSGSSSGSSSRSSGSSTRSRSRDN